MTENSIRGIFTPCMVPLDSSGRINESELRRYIEWLITQGIHGLYPNGSTGEFTRFTADERIRIVQIVCDQARDRVPILAGASEANVKETLWACEAYKEMGATAVAVVSPFYYPLSPDNVYAYFREIALNTPIDVTLYNIPKFASPIDLLTFQRLAEFQRIIGIKDSSGDIAQMLRMMAAVEKTRPEFFFLTGWDPALVPMLAMGCHGATLALSGIVPEVTKKIYELMVAGQFAEAKILQAQLTELFDRVVYGADFPEGVRLALESRGFHFGVGRQPIDTTHQLDRSALSQTIDSMLSELPVA